MRAIQVQSPVFLEDVVNARLERVWTEEERISAHGIRVRPPKGVLIFANNLNVGTHEDLKAGTEAVPSVVLRCGCTVHEVRMRIHGVIVKGPDQPGIEPVVCAGKPACKIDCTCRSDSRRRRARRGSKQRIVGMTVHAQTKKLQFAVLETKIAAHAIEGLLNGCQDTGKQ